MAMNPAVQKKVQEELDAVIPAEGRLPSLKDRPMLPYLEAVWKETMRWSPPFPLRKSIARFMAQ